MLDTSDVPDGVVNIVTGDRDHLTKTLVQHEDVDSVWYFGSAEGSYHVKNESAANMKRMWVGYSLPRDWMDREQGEGHEFLHEATQVKNIWVADGGVGYLIKKSPKHSRLRRFLIKPMFLRSTRWKLSFPLR